MADVLGARSADPTQCPGLYLGIGRGCVIRREPHEIYPRLDHRRPGRGRHCPALVSSLDAAGSAFLYPELVHGQKSGGTFRFELVPAIQIGHGPVHEKALGVFVAHGSVEAKKRKIVGREEFFDRRNGGLVLLDVKKHIPATARRKEI
jgi:hypothetical protein